MFPVTGKYILTALLAVVFGSYSSGQGSDGFRHILNPGRENIEISYSNSEIRIDYNISELELHQINVPEGSFYRISVPGHIPSSDKGKPELPVYSRLFSLPGKDYLVKITDIKTKVIRPARNNIRGKVFPRQEEGTKSQDKQLIKFEIDKQSYNRRGYLFSDTVRVEYIGKSRDMEIGKISLFPVRYSPRDNELEVITSMRIIIGLSGPEGITKSESREALPFIQSFSKGLLNYTSEDLITGYSDEPVKMVLITDTAFRKTLSPYMKWKTQKGFRLTTLYRGAAFAGNSFTELRDTLRKVYMKEKLSGTPPVFLLIVGDNSRIPLSEGTANASDLYYTTFDGPGDYLPELFTGRISVSDTSELKAVLKKIIQYEKFQFADSNSYHERTLATAGDDAGYSVYMNGQLRYLSKYYLDSASNIKNHVFYYPQSLNARDSIVKILNRGVGFVNYSGHGDAYGWLRPLFKSDDVTKLTNKNMYPFVISNACRTGQFSLAGSFGNTLLKSADKGAIGFIGCSNDSYWSEDFYWSVGVGSITANPLYEETGLGAYDRMFHKFNEKASDWYVTMGQINYAGNLAVSGSTTTRKKYYWETYNLSGDPSIIPYIGPLSAIKVSLPDILPNRIRSVTLNLEPFTYIAISRRDTLLDARYASPSGTVTLDIPEISNDSCLVVITGQNRKPFIKTIYFGNIAETFLNLTEVAVNDLPGNNNGKADYGETLYLKLTISNLGAATATDLHVKISASSPGGVSILNDSVRIGTLAGKKDTVLNNQLILKVNDLIQDKSYITLNILVKDSFTEKNYKADLRLHAPVLKILNCTIDDTESGSGDMTADPGEKLNLIFNVRNSGSSNASGYLFISSQSTGVYFDASEIVTGHIREGETRSISVPVTLSPLLQPGSRIEVSVTVECSQYKDSKDFSVSIGKTRESFEYRNFSLFPWNNTFTNPWIITSGDAWEGAFSARSAPINNNSESKLALTVNTPYPDSVSFMYKVSSERNYDLFTFWLNGLQVLTASGETGWKKHTLMLKEGINRLEWNYKKDQSVAAGSDCAWLDYLIFPPYCFSKVDIKTGKIHSPETGKKTGQEAITAEVINFGTDTLKKVNMAYNINNGQPVTEIFSMTIAPGDTSEITFSAKADLSSNGPFILKVFGSDNNDSYPENDTTKAVIINTSILKIRSDNDNLKVMPNPFSESIRVTFSHDSREKALFSIHNTGGVKIWEDQFVLYPGENVFQLSPGNIAPGYYTLVIKGKTVLKSAGLIKTD